MAEPTLSENRFYVYILRRPDKKDPFDESKGQPFYVGKGCNGRIHWHRQEANRLLHKSGRKYLKISIIHKLWKQGLDFQEEIIFDNLTEQESFELESKYIEKYGRQNKETGCLANFTDGGEGSSGYIASIETRQKISNSHQGKKGFPHTEESKRKMSIARRGKKLSPEHCLNITKALTGRIHSEETKRKIGEKSKGRITTRGRKHTEEERRKIRENRKKYVPSDETRKKLSEAGKGRILSEETRRKIGDRHRGKKFSEESRLKLRKSCMGRIPWNKGIPHSEETKRKISEFHLKRHREIKLKNDSSSAQNTSNN